MTLHEDDTGEAPPNGTREVLSLAPARPDRPLLRGVAGPGDVPDDLREVAGA